MSSIVTPPSPKSLRVRAATAADAPALMDLLRELAAYENATANMRATEAVLREALGATPPRVHAGLAEDAEGPVGYVSFTVDFMVWYGGPVIRLDDLYVRERARRAGAGRLLMRHVAEVALAGSMAVRWEMNPSNDTARAFYGRIGALSREKTVFSWHPEAMRRFVGEPGAPR